MRNRIRLAVVPLVVMATAISTTAEAATAASNSGGRHNVAEVLRAMLVQQRFEEVLDTDPIPIGGSSARSSRPTVDKEAAARTRAFAAADPKPIAQQPQLDATIIELDAFNRPVRSGTVLMSPKYKDGIVVPVDRNMYTDKVRWRDWDDSGWYTNRGQGTVDSIPGRENAPIDQMEIYPASVLKLMVGFGVLQLVDKGTVKLTDTYTYEPTTVSTLCGPATAKTVGTYLGEMLTESLNSSSCALIKLMHDRAHIDTLNATFKDIGLDMLQLRDTNPVNGGRWQNSITMTSLDTAKLLTLVNGAPGTVWTAPNGKRVTRDVLSSSSRALFKRLLGQQGYNEVLSTTNWCGRDYPAAGIPQQTHPRWINPTDGTVTVEGKWYGRDVRPCNTTAQVRYSHKTGLVWNGAADAGIVQSLPGKAGRNYIVVIFSNLGDQYRDASRPETPPGVYPVAYTEKFAKLGKAIDTYEAKR